MTDTFYPAIRTPNRMEDRLITDDEVRKILGGVSHMWVRRRRVDPTFRFPRVVRTGRKVRTWLGDVVRYADSPHLAMRTERSASFEGGERVAA
jgi:predicted DNA-binding transcriptional regulator AlpA